MVPVSSSHFLDYQKIGRKESSKSSEMDIFLRSGIKWGKALTARRAAVKRKSLRRFRYTMTAGGWSKINVLKSGTRLRSARRQTARARCSEDAARPPGKKHTPALNLAYVAGILCLTCNVSPTSKFEKKGLGFSSSYQAIRQHPSHLAEVNCSDYKLQVLDFSQAKDSVL